MRVPQSFNISSKFNLLENLCIVLQIYAQSDVRCKVYNSTFHVCVTIPIHKLNPYFCCFKDLVIGFLFYIASINNVDLKIFHPGQRHLTRNRYICIKTKLTELCNVSSRTHVLALLLAIFVFTLM